MPTPNPPVLIIGAGIGGLAATIALQRAGQAVRVFERADRLTDVGAGLTLWPNALIALRRLGLAEAVLSASARLERVEVRTASGRSLLCTEVGELWNELGAPAVGIARPELQRILLSAVPRECLTLASHCVDVHEDGEGVAARFEDGRTVTGAALIGADGLRSVVRAALHGPEPPRSAETFTWRGLARLDHPELAGDTTIALLGRGTQLGVVPIGDGWRYWFAAVNRPLRDELPDDDVLECLHDRLPRLWPPFRQLIERSEDAPHRAWIQDRPSRRPWGRGRITLLGDAAHPTTPNLGQGACQAIEDAVVLAARLVSAGDVAEALRGYEGARFARTERIVRESRRMGAILQLESRLPRLLRDLTIRVLPARWQLQRQRWAFEAPRLERPR